MGIARIEGWEVRLSAAIEQSRSAPYVLGKNDCLRVAARVLEALTGRNIWPMFEGKYSTRKEALALFMNQSVWEEFADEPRPNLKEEIRSAIRKTQSVFDAAFSLLFETWPEDMRLARRGDICKYNDGLEDHLGVVLGANVAVLVDEGLLFTQRSACAHCWRIS